MRANWGRHCVTVWPSGVFGVSSTHYNKIRHSLRSQEAACDLIVDLQNRRSHAGHESFCKKKMEKNQQAQTNPLDISTVNHWKAACRLDQSIMDQ